MDDFTVYGSSFDACLDSLDRVLNRCIQSNLVLNFEKCHFLVEQGIVLGHIISKKGIEVDPAKISIISQLPYPSSVREVRSFLCHVGFYRRFFVLNCKKKYINTTKKNIVDQVKRKQIYIGKKSRKRRIQKNKRGGEFNTTFIAILFVVYWYLLPISLSLRVSVLSHLNLFGSPIIF